MDSQCYVSIKTSYIPLKRFCIQQNMCGVLMNLCYIVLQYYTFHTRETLIWKKSRDTCPNPKSNPPVKIVTRRVASRDFYPEGPLGRRTRTRLFPRRFYEQIFTYRLRICAQRIRTRTHTGRGRCTGRRLSIRPDRLLKT